MNAISMLSFVDRQLSKAGQRNTLLEWETQQQIQVAERPETHVTRRRCTTYCISIIMTIITRMSMRKKRDVGRSQNGQARVVVRAFAKTHTADADLTTLSKSLNFAAFEELSRRAQLRPTSLRPSSQQHRRHALHPLWYFASIHRWTGTKC